MRILLITQLYPPEMGAQANRMYPFVRRLVAAGHEVFVATGMPNYPEGVVFPEYRGRRFLREARDGATILRTAYFPAPRNQGKWTQLRSYLSFLLAAFRGGLRAGKVDIVFVTSPPLFPAIAAILLARLRGAKLVLDLRDLWPDEIVACGAAGDGSLPVRLLRALERWAYRRADCVSCTTRAFIETVVARGVPRARTLFAPNGADLERFRPLPADNPVAREYPFGDRFVVLYSGLLGIKHGLETVLDAAHRLRDEKDIVFFFLGNGARRRALQERAEAMGLDNVLWGGERGVDEIPCLLARADVCLSCLLPDPYFEKIISVKVFEYMACERPVISAQAGETARIVAESGGGVVVPPGDARALAEAILALRRDSEHCREMGKNGRRYVEENYSRGIVAARLEETLTRLLGAASGDEVAAVQTEVL